VAQVKVTVGKWMTIVQDKIRAACIFRLYFFVEAERLPVLDSLGLPLHQVPPHGKLCSW
jgi:hypothetical protein